MLLADYLGQCDNIATSVSRQVHIIAGATFEFGERYMIVSHYGACIDIPVLDDILSIMRDEMISQGALPCCRMSDWVLDKRGSNIPRRKNLVVYGVTKGFSVGAVDAKVDQVRHAVLTHILTDEWAPFTKDNL